MPSSMAYMVSMLAMASGLVVLMLGFSGLHASLYQMQANIDEQDMHIRRANQVQEDFSAQLKRLSTSLRQVASTQEDMQNSAMQQDVWRRHSDKTSGEHAEQLAALVEKVDMTSSQLEALLTSADQLREAHRNLNATLNATEIGMGEVQLSVQELGSQHRILRDQVQTWRDREQMFEGQVNEATNGLKEQLSQLAQGLQSMILEKKEVPQAKVNTLASKVRDKHASKAPVDSSPRPTPAKSSASVKGIEGLADKGAEDGLSLKAPHMQAHSKDVTTAASTDAPPSTPAPSVAPRTILTPGSSDKGSTSSPLADAKATSPTLPAIRGPTSAKDSTSPTHPAVSPPPAVVTGLWPLWRDHHCKCHHDCQTETCYIVADQAHCQDKAVQNGHKFYSYRASRKKCSTNSVCKPDGVHIMCDGTYGDWYVYSRDAPTRATSLEVVTSPTPGKEAGSTSPTPAVDAVSTSPTLAGDSSSPSSAGGLFHSASPEYRLSWYRECGCTGMEIEAVTLLLGLVARLGAARIRTNPCSDTCSWPAATRAVLERIEIQEEGRPMSKLLWAEKGASSTGKLVLVVHAAFISVCGIPDLWDESNLERNLASQIRDRPRNEMLRISRSMLESDRLDQATVERCNNNFDAVWVPSSFNVRTFTESGVISDIIKVLPESIDPGLYNCSKGLPPVRPFTTFKLDRLDQFLAEGRDDNTFTFLSVFKWESRKNWQMLLKTFLETFPKKLTYVEPEQGLGGDIVVRLLIKTQQLSWSTVPEEDLDLVYSHLGIKREEVESRLLIIKDPLPTALLPSLYRAVDAFVMPTHGEGWGLPLMEAMASGLPTIATGWGGHTEFMHEGNSLLLGHDLVPAEGAEGQWAQPNATQLQEAMLGLVRRTASSRAMAERACREVPGDRFSPDAVARRVDELVAASLSSMEATAPMVAM